MSRDPLTEGGWSVEFSLMAAGFMASGAEMQWRLRSAHRREVAYAKAIEWEIINPAEQPVTAVMPPAARIMPVTEDELQRLLGSIWGMGLRPHSEGTIGQMKAMQDHIDTLRQIIFQGGLQPLRPVADQG